ncbi:BA75_00290T0 [Komagataella pastoris]|uniref:BA75_00290T0 n=1 Tax=Komagataella pastoris TaxID=4922 RepID=A0A1B2J5L2_PICPA|nr:BA75_00290T0 [Komagataella pastoris]
MIPDTWSKWFDRDTGIDYLYGLKSNKPDTATQGKTDHPLLTFILTNITQTWTLEINSLKDFIELSGNNGVEISSVDDLYKTMLFLDENVSNLDSKITQVGFLYPKDGRSMFQLTNISESVPKKETFKWVFPLNLVSDATALAISQSINFQVFKELSIERFQKNCILHEIDKKDKLISKLLDTVLESYSFSSGNGESSAENSLQEKTKILNNKTLAKIIPEGHSLRQSLLKFDPATLQAQDPYKNVCIWDLIGELLKERNDWRHSNEYSLSRTVTESIEKGDKNIINNNDSFYHEYMEVDEFPKNKKHIESQFEKNSKKRKFGKVSASVPVLDEVNQEKVNMFGKDSNVNVEDVNAEIYKPKRRKFGVIKSLKRKLNSSSEVAIKSQK